MKALLLFLGLVAVALCGLTKSPQYGGSGGGPYDNPVESYAKVSSLTVGGAYPYYGPRLGGIQVCYTNVSGGAYVGSETCYPRHGCSPYCTYTSSMKLDADESISQTRIAGGGYVDTVTFTSTKGKTLSAGSALDAVHTQTYSGDAFFSGIFGRSGEVIDALGFYSRTPDNVCGDGVVTGDEQCDGTPCCTSTCTFASTTTVCRGAAGLCDKIEYCTGTSDTCPADEYQPKGTACGQFFGMCDVSLQNSCSGDSAQCASPDAYPLLADSLSWVDFNVISFDSYQNDGGKVEGRVASRNYLEMSSFSVGDKLTFATDSWRPYSIFVAGDASLNSGSIFPDGSNLETAGPAAFAFVGGSLTAPTYLKDRWIQNFTVSSATNAFDQAKTYFSDIQGSLSAIPSNTKVSVIYGNGLNIECDGDSALYHASVDGATLSGMDWFNLVGCTFNARWVIDVTGTGDVTLKGEPFPGIVERVVLNVVGSGRDITGQSAVSANILAPENNYIQYSGVTYGTLIAGNVTAARQNAKPNCLVFSPVKISTKVTKPVTIGDTTIWVVDLANFIAGDKICINGNCQTIISGAIYETSPGVYDHAITVSDGFTTNSPVGAVASTSVQNPDSASRGTPLATAVSPSVSFPPSASSIIAPLFALVGLALSLLM